MSKIGTLLMLAALAVVIVMFLRWLRDRRRGEPGRFGTEDSSYIWTPGSGPMTSGRTHAPDNTSGGSDGGGDGGGGGGSD